MSQSSTPSTAAYRTSRTEGVRVNPGIYYGRVLNNLDPSRMGQVRVAVYNAGKPGAETDSKLPTIHCRPINPFIGQTPASGLTLNDTYDHNQKSYGIHIAPPDFGTLCIICVVEGGDGAAYLLGYVQDDFMNANQLNNFEAEYNKRLRPPVTFDPDTNERKPNDQKPFKGNSSPSAPLYENRVKLEKVAGYYADPDRGPQTSSARRDLPSMVQGWSSPGHYKYDGPKINKTPENEGKVVNEIPYSRLGGTSIIMDDGNPGLYRTTLAKDGKREYVPAPSGERTIPHSEQFRIETRTGHKIILHNSEDFISILHSNGDSWIEFTANGKIDVYSRGGISMATEKDEKANINFHAYQFNIDVDELNISAKTAINIEQRSDPEADPNFALKVADGKLDILTTTGLDIQNKIHDGSAITEGTFKFKHNFETKTLELLSGSLDDQFVAITYNHETQRLEFNAPEYIVNTTVTDQTISLIQESNESNPIGPFQFEEMPNMIHDMPASYTKIDEEKTKYSDHDTLKTPLGRVPRKHPWRHTENLDPTKYVPEKILYGVEEVEDSEPIYAKTTISDTGIAAKSVTKDDPDKGGY